MGGTNRLQTLRISKLRTRGSERNGNNASSTGEQARRVDSGGHHTREQRIPSSTLPKFELAKSGLPLSKIGPEKPGSDMQRRSKQPHFKGSDRRIGAKPKFKYRNQVFMHLQTLQTRCKGSTCSTQSPEDFISRVAMSPTQISSSPCTKT